MSGRGPRSRLRQLRDRRVRRHAWSAALLIAVATAAACGGESPTSPSAQFTLTGSVSDGSEGLPSIDLEILTGPNKGQRAITDSAGRYTLPSLVASEFFLRASANGYEPQTLFVNFGDVTADFRLSRRSDSGTNNLVSVSGVVRDADSGTPIPDADVVVTVGSDTGRTTTTDIDGRFLLARLQPGAIALEVAAPGYRPTTRQLVAGDAEPLNVALERESVVDPDLVSLSGLIWEVLAPTTERAPVEGALVVLVDGSNATRTVRTDGVGRYRLDQLAPGPATLEVSAPEFETFTTSVTLDGSTTVDVELARVEAVVTTPGRVVDVLSGVGLADVTITGLGLTRALSDATGAFEIGGRSGSTAPRPVDLTSPDIVPRRAYIRVPDTETEISVIPASFNLTAFDEMLRQPRLRRWRTAPPLIVERQALQFSDVDMAEGTALDDPMSDEELQSLLTDLRWTLPLLTGDRFPAFAGVTERVTEPGTMSTLLTAGSITIVRVEGLTAATGSWGWSRWLFESDGSVTGGVMMLDLDFDRSASPFRRSLRAHELGHTLGYTHVMTEPSVMHPEARLEPTAFDRDATRIAFSRFPGNIAPDIEPDPRTLSSSLGTATWSRPIR